LKEGGWARVLFLNDSATIDHLLSLRSIILGGLQKVAQTDGDSAGSLDSVRGEERSSCTTCKGRESGEGTDGDQDGAQCGHDLWMLGGQEV